MGSVLGVTPPTQHDGGRPVRGNNGMPSWVSRYGWALLVTGVILGVLGLVVQRNVMTRGGPFVLGLLCVLVGLAGALRRHRGPRS